MRRLLLTGAVLLAAWGPDAPAQTQTTNLGGMGGAGGAASAIGGAGGKAIARSGSATGGNVTINGGADNSSGWHDPLVASAVAPSFGVAGACTGRAASAAGQFQLFGLSFGGTDMDKACQSEHLGNVQTIGEKIGFEVMCDDSQFRKAALRAHYACSADQTAAPLPEPPTPPTKPTYCTAGRGWTEAQLKRRYPECRT